VAFCGAQIITGEEEGAYGWITINYLLESFTKVGGVKHPLLCQHRRKGLSAVIWGKQPVIL